MSDVTEAIDRYVAVWNETDEGRRRALAARTLADGARLVDPMTECFGPEAFAAAVGGVRGQFPGMRLRRTTPVDAHHDCVRFGWEFGPEGGEPVVAGIDVGVVSDGLIRSLTGFFDKAPGNPGE